MSIAWAAFLLYSLSPVCAAVLSATAYAITGGDERKAQRRGFYAAHAKRLFRIWPAWMRYC